ncbi:MAG: hypothetical protein Q9160_002139 [Pyrenula sp. 1 TL-2023]
MATFRTQETQKLADGRPEGPAPIQGTSKDLISCPKHLINCVSSDTRFDPSPASKINPKNNLPFSNDDATKKSPGRSLRPHGIFTWAGKAFRPLSKSIGRTIWLKEVLSSIISLAALAIMAFLLSAYQDRTIPRWPSLISFNSLISTFTSIMKAAMLVPVAEGISELKWTWFARARPLTDLDRYDAASRSPLGALTLLRKRYLSLASMGALIAIFALAIDPFTQQTLQYYDCLQPLESVPAMIERTSNLTSGFVLEGSANAPLVAGLYQGLLDPPTNASAGISIGCQSGNCTFPHENGIAYSSLALCSSVDDRSHMIQNDSAAHNYTLHGNGDSYLSIDTESIVLVSADITDFLGYSVDRPLLMLDVLMFIINCEGNSETSTSHCVRRPWASNASLYPCVHTYGEVYVSNSIFHETIMSKTALPFASMNLGPTDHDYSLAGDFASFAGVNCAPSKTPWRTKTQATYPLGNGSRAVGSSGRATSAEDIAWYDRACTYGFGAWTTFALQGYFPNFFGTPQSPNSLSLDPDNERDWSRSVGDPWLRRMYANGSANLTTVRAFMEGLANAVTPIIRRYGDAEDSAPVKGTVLVNRTCVHVAWEWLILPVALLLLTFSFFTATVIKSWGYTRDGETQVGNRAWKSSSLPLLWCGLTDDMRRQYGGSDELAKMKECADEICVRMVRRDKKQGGGGWELRGS